LHGVVVTKVQDPAFGLGVPHANEEIDTPTQLDVICKLTEGALDSLIQIINKDIKKDWPLN